MSGDFNFHEKINSGDSLIILTEPGESFRCWKKPNGVKFEGTLLCEFKKLKIVVDSTGLKNEYQSLQNWTYSTEGEIGYYRYVVR